MTYKKTLLALGLLAASGSAMAAETGYLGIASGTTTYDYTAVTDSTSFMVYGGFRQYNSPLGVEVAYIDLGQSDYILSANHWQMKGYGVYGTLSTAAYSRSPMAFYGKAGFYHLNTTDTAMGKDSGGGFSWGVGMEYSPVREFAVRAELVGFLNTPDADQQKDVYNFNVGINVKF
jgi:hypothetical protein